MPLKRDLIVQAVMTRMAGILSTGGYYSNLGSNVFEWRPKGGTEGGGGDAPTEQAELPAIHIRDTIDDPSRMNVKGDERHDLSLEVEIAHEAAAPGRAVRKDIQDVRKDVGPRTNWGGT